MRPEPNRTGHIPFLTKICSPISLPFACVWTTYITCQNAIADAHHKRKQKGRSSQSRLRLEKGQEKRKKKKGLQRRIEEKKKRTICCCAALRRFDRQKGNANDDGNWWRAKPQSRQHLYFLPLLAPMQWKILFSCVLYPQTIGWRPCPAVQSVYRNARQKLYIDATLDFFILPHTIKYSCNLFQVRRLAIGCINHSKIWSSRLPLQGNYRVI